MATGDITATIRPDGWSVDLSVAGFTRGASYAFGLGANNTPGANTPYFTVVSLGYDDTGAATTVTRRVYLTSIVRFPYATAYIAGTYVSGAFVDGEIITQAVSGATGVVVGNQPSGTRLYFKSITGTFDNLHLITGGTSGATFTSSSVITTPAQPTNDEKDTGSALVVRVALSDYIFQKDNSGGGNSGTAPTFTAPASFITNAGGANQTSTASTASAVTQSSAAAYPRVVANWSWPGWGKFTASSKLRCVAFHASGQSGRPVRAVKFTTTDGTTTVTEYVTAPTYDSTAGDATPIVEYISTADHSAGMTQGATLTHNFVAYPWVGDSTSILDTGDGVNSNATTPTPLYAPQLSVCDKTGAYATSLAVVDPAGGNDGTGAVSTVLATATSTPYLTMAAAFNGLRTYNNSNYSRNNCGGSVMYLRTGTNAFVNGSVTLGTTPAAWLTVTRHPSDAKSGVILGTAATGNSLGLRLKVEDVTVTSTGTVFSPGGNSALWLKNCTLSSSAGATIYQNKVWFITGSTISTSASTSQWFRENSTENWACALIRGNTMTFLGSATLRSYNVIGNLKTGNSTGSFLLSWFVTSQTVPTTENNIVGFNRFYGLNVSSAPLIGWGSTDRTCTHGTAIVQNVMENITNTSSPLVQIGADGSTTAASNPVNNVIFWNNTLAGQRNNFAYNDTTTNGPARLYWSVKNNLTYDDNIKTDTFAPADGLRTGDWPQVYGVNWTGNLILDSGNGFNHDFVGLSTLYHDWTGSNQGAYVLFTSYAAAIVGTSNGAGGGDYTLQLLSPAKGLQYDWTIPYDLAGNPRSSYNDAGAYATRMNRSRTALAANGRVSVQP